MTKLNGEHLERGLSDILEKVSLDDVTTKGVLDKYKLKKVLYKTLKKDQHEKN